MPLYHQVAKSLWNYEINAKLTITFNQIKNVVSLQLAKDYLKILKKVIKMSAANNTEPFQDWLTLRAALLSSENHKVIRLFLSLRCILKWYFSVFMWRLQPLCQ